MGLDVLGRAPRRPQVGMALQARMASAEGLARGARYFASVRATDGAGHRAAATSDGVRVGLGRTRSTYQVIGVSISETAMRPNTRCGSRASAGRSRRRAHSSFRCRCSPGAARCKNNAKQCSVTSKFIAAGGPLLFFVITLF